MSAKKKTAKTGKTAKKTTVKKAAPKKTGTASKKAVVKKKALPKKAVKKSPAKKKTAVRAKKAPAKGAAKKPTSAARKTAPKKKTEAGGEKPSQAGDAKATNGEDAKKILSARKRKHTPAIFKTKSRKNTPVIFSLDDVKEILESRKAEDPKPGEPAEEKPLARTGAAPKSAGSEETPAENRSWGAASLSDILGFNPTEEGDRPEIQPEDAIPQKYRKYYKALVTLRTEVLQDLEAHTQETLKRSSKDDSGDLSGYGQHMADAGTDSFERDFALSMVSNEQEALYEIEEAIKRIHRGEYGHCEITGEPIDKERLMAVPFTRYSVEGQRELERNRRRNKRGGGGVFADSASDDTTSLGDEDSET